MTMYLVDTDVISEARKGEKAKRGVRQFFQDADRNSTPRYLSAVTIGELRQGVEIVRHRRRGADARIGTVVESNCQHVRRIHSWTGRRGCRNLGSATELINDLTVVTRNTAHFFPTGVQILNPFVQGQ